LYRLNSEAANRGILKNFCSVAARKLNYFEEHILQREA